MAVKIRLRRMGSNKQPFFRVVVTDMRCPNSGRFLETVGWYDPKRKGSNYELKVERIEYWTDKGAQVSDTVRSLLKKNRATQRRAAAPA
ncbi:MAG TPA: 30S ribosomal protein S16 [Kiritimatiellia bacterium]|nr:30S ribosomal protein S16 [Kiritimatiellia bacterium]HRZ11619.1 30S ribosomal protein S16 [Kiritimatiellia bacterium]HSA16830.1 30S ribosomal protein S16 [Kiritimatiellia bacterium]